MNDSISDIVKELRVLANASNQFAICRTAADALTQLSEQAAEAKTNQLGIEEELADTKARLAEAVKLLDGLLGLEKGSGQAALVFVAANAPVSGTGNGGNDAS